MLRVIRSTVQAVSIPSTDEDLYIEAVEAGDVHRETATRGVRTIKLVAYTTPDQQDRWAVTDTDETEVDWQDSDDLAEAITLYEATVREAADCMGEEYEELVDDETGEPYAGDVLPPFGTVDVPGVRGYEEGAEVAGNAGAWMVEAQRKDAADKVKQDEAAASTRARQIAVARAVDTWGRGGQAALARRLGLSEPTVKQLADRGRALLAEADPQA